MTYYNLAVENDPGRVLATVAEDRQGAFDMFEAVLGERLTLDDQGKPAPYLLDEWEESPHWVNPNIPVFDIPT
ncbi:MAG: hypothetical protein WD470_10705 [Rhodospirillaceae bacterium]